MECRWELQLRAPAVVFHTGKKRVGCHWVCRGVFRMAGLNVFGTELTRAGGLYDTLRKAGTVLWHLLLSTVSQLPP